MLRIGLILPDLLGTYGDDGNALILRQRARMRGIDAEIIAPRYGEPVPDSLDLYTVGGAEDAAQVLAAQHLNKDQGIHRAAANGTPILAICAGFQIFGESFRANGTIVPGLGLIDATTQSMGKRAIGEVVTTPLIDELALPLTGFENHMGATILGPDAKPLGQVTAGIGNCDAHAAEVGQSPASKGVEGAVQGSIIATYMHGPALSRNPELADLLLARAMGVEVSELSPLDIPAVEQLRQERIAAA